MDGDNFSLLERYDHIVILFFINILKLKRLPKLAELRNRRNTIALCYTI